MNGILLGNILAAHIPNLEGRNSNNYDCQNF